MQQGDVIGITPRAEISYKSCCFSPTWPSNFPNLARARVFYRSYNLGYMKKIFSVRWMVVVCACLLCGKVPLPAYAGAAAESSQQVPIMDGEAGPCSLELTVTGPDGKPVYAAKVNVHMAYGFGGIRRLDLEGRNQLRRKAEVHRTSIPSAPATT